MKDDIMKMPSREGLAPGQVWVWMSGPGDPHWEVRGTGLRLSELEEEGARVRKLWVSWNLGYYACQLGRDIEDNPYEARLDEIVAQLDAERS